MFPNDTDGAWDYFGKADPYFDKATMQRLGIDDPHQSREQYFAFGRRYIDWVFDTIEECLAPSFHPQKAMDFGCGNGRLLLPLSKRCTSVTGVDVSKPMLEEASRNCKENQISNVQLVRGDIRLSNVAGPFDLINSYVVLQHIPPKRGEKILRRLIELLSPDGVGVLHLTYCSKDSLGIRLLLRAYKTIPFFYSVRNLLKGRPFREPWMQMNEYNLNHVFRILQETGCHRCLVRFTDHSMYGVVLFFQKRSLAMM